MRVDIDRRGFVPISGCEQSQQNLHLFDHLVGLDEHGLRNGEAECFGRLEVDHHLPFGGCEKGISPALAPLRICCTSAAIRLASSPRWGA